MDLDYEDLDVMPGEKKTRWPGEDFEEGYEESEEYDSDYSCYR